MQTHITPAHLRAWDARYSDEAIAAIYGGRESLTPLEILSLDIPAEDRLWVVLRSEVLGVRDLRLVVCGIAERAIPLFEARFPGDDRPRRAVSIARRFARGEASADELDAVRAATKDVAFAAARAAAGAAWDVQAAAWAAARAAAKAAAEDTTKDAAWDAADAAADAVGRVAADAIARDAAGATWAAARRVGVAAEREAQTAIVRGYLERAEETR